MFLSFLPLLAEITSCASDCVGVQPHVFCGHCCEHKFSLYCNLMFVASSCSPSIVSTTTTLPVLSGCQHYFFSFDDWARWSSVMSISWALGQNRKFTWGLDQCWWAMVLTCSPEKTISGTALPRTKSHRQPATGSDMTHWALHSLGSNAVSVHAHAPRRAGGATSHGCMLRLALGYPMPNTSTSSQLRVD